MVRIPKPNQERNCNVTELKICFPNYLNPGAEAGTGCSLWDREYRETPPSPPWRTMLIDHDLGFHEGLSLKIIPPDSVLNATPGIMVIADTGS